MADIGELLIRELALIVDAFVARLRSERIGAAAESLPFSQLADHIGTYFADLGSVLIAIDESRGQSSPLVVDGTDIQRLVADRHGVQRAGLGWTEDALHREWAVLSDELAGVIQRRAARMAGDAESEALVIVRRFMEQGEALSCQALTRALRTNGEALPEALPRSQRVVEDESPSAE